MLGKFDRVVFGPGVCYGYCPQAIAVTPDGRWLERVEIHRLGD